MYTTVPLEYSKFVFLEQGGILHREGGPSTCQRSIFRYTSCNALKLSTTAAQSLE